MIEKNTYLETKVRANILGKKIGHYYTMTRKQTSDVLIDFNRVYLFNFFFYLFLPLFSDT